MSLLRTVRRKIMAGALAGGVVAGATVGVNELVTEEPTVGTSVLVQKFGIPCRVSAHERIDVFGFGDRTWHRKAVLPLLAAVERAERISNYRPDLSVGTYNCRPIRGFEHLGPCPSNCSTHAWPVSLDLDPSQNGFGVPLPFTEIGNEPKFVRAFTSFFFRWGGTFGAGRTDAMHFEYRGQPVPLRDDLEPGTFPGVPALRAHLDRLELPHLIAGKYRGDEVKLVIQIQRAYKLIKIDGRGVVGPATWTYLANLKAPE